MTRYNKPVNVCGDCKHATPDMKQCNLSITGEPILVSCPFAEHKQNITEKACINFKSK